MPSATTLLINFIRTLISQLDPSGLLAVARAALEREINAELLRAIDALVRRAEGMIGVSGGDKLAFVLEQLHSASPIISQLAQAAGSNLVRRAIELAVAELKRRAAAS